MPGIEQDEFGMKKLIQLKVNGKSKKYTSSHGGVWQGY